MSEEVITEGQEPTKKKRPKSKARKIIEWVLVGIFLAIAAVIGAGQIDGMVHKDQYYGQSIRFGVGSFYVLTNSMQGVYDEGTAIITYREDVGKIYSDFKSGVTIDMTFVNVDCGVSEYSIDFTTPDFRPENGGQKVVTNKVMTHRLREIHLDETKPVGQGRYVFVLSGVNDKGESSLKGQYQLMTEKQYLGKVVIGSAFLGGVFHFVSSPWGLLVLLLIPAFYLIVASAIDIFRALKDTDGEDGGDSNQSVESLSSLSKEDRERLKREMLDELMDKKGK